MHSYSITTYRRYLGYERRRTHPGWVAVEVRFKTVDSAELERIRLSLFARKVYKLK
jgi:hypothetical protein